MATDERETSGGPTRLTHLEQQLQLIGGGLPTAGVEPMLADATPEAAGAPTSAVRPPAASAPPLTAQQLQVLLLVCEGYSNRQIASHVHMSEHTVKWHLDKIYRVLDVHTRVEAAVAATKAGWI